MAAMGTGTLPLNPQNMQQVRSEIRGIFTRLRDSFQVTSWEMGTYNCIAWAAEDHGRWWWPDPDGESYWPLAQREDTVDGFVEAFRQLEYEPCGDDDSVEPGFEKVAIYAVNGRTKHMARQLASGAWTSKLGDWWDIGHESIEEVYAPHYGTRAVILRRRALDIVPIPSAT